MSKNKKMSFKAFKEIFNRYYNLEIWGFEGILAQFERMEWDDAKRYQEDGLESAKRASLEKANALHDILANIGYYDI